MSSPVGALELPQGYGLRLLKQTSRELSDLMGKLLVWEAPRKGFRYVAGVDVSGGLGLDRSVIDVTRVGTIELGEEQVAQFVADDIDPVVLASYIDAIGRFYKWSEEELPAMVAIECNGMGIATQAQLLQHYGYDHLFIWRHEDAINPKSRFTRSYGWYTTPRSRPIILARYVKAVTTWDERTGLPDYRINSPFTLEELRDFQSDGPLWRAEAGPGSHDDCIMAGAIGIHVSQTLQLEEGEPLPDRRRRISEERLRKEKYAALHGHEKPDFINTDCTAEEMFAREEGDEEQEIDWTQTW